MNYSLENEFLKVEVNDFGAELQSVKGKKSGFEYLWQGNPEFWKSRAINLFPFCGRLFNGTYTYAGKEYKINLHGFARNTMFTMENKTENTLTFSIKSNEETLEVYPFNFVFKVIFTLEKNKLTTTYFVENTDDKTIYFSVGGHPGFNVPFDGKGKFTDYYLEYSKKCKPQQLVFSENLLYGGLEDYKLKDDKIMPLDHNLFNIDAVFLTNTDKKVTLKSTKCNNTLTVGFDKMSYVGVWHKPRTEAPYVCIEPWKGVPGREGVIEDITTKLEIVSLDKNKTYTNGYYIEINE